MADSVAGYLRALALCVAYIAVSSALIRFNKYMMAEENFPFSMQLSALHMSMSMGLCCLLYLAKPSLFPAMESTRGRRAEVLQWFVPIGAAFAAMLYLSNQAYLYSNVTFLQFMKETNPILTFLLSCAVGLQVMTRVRLAVILWVVAGSLLAVTGELHFVMMGFVLQGLSQLAECTRAVLNEWVLSGRDLKLDPLTFTMFMAPFCLAVLLVGNFFTWDPRIPQRAAECWHLLLPNACLAFLLNVLVAMCIKETSAVGYQLTGMVKDIFLVLFSACFFDEVVTGKQYVGFSITVAGIFFWGFMKTAPDHPLVKGVEGALGPPPQAQEKDGGARPADETTALISNMEKDLMKSV